MSWPDSRVLLSAWEKFGDAVWPMLRGPFAAAIWDPQRSRFDTGARSSRAQCRHVAPERALLRLRHHAQRPVRAGRGARELSEEKFADFLVLNHAEHATTIYKDVFRVRPAHVMRVEVRRCHQHITDTGRRTTIKAGEAFVPIRIMRTDCANASMWPCDDRCAAPIRSAACSAAASTRPRSRSLRRVRSPRKISG